MKIKRIIAMAASLVMALAALSGCSSSRSRENDSINSSAQAAYDSIMADQEAEENYEPTAVEEPDFLGFLTGENDADFYGMSFQEFVGATDGKCTAENAEEYDPDSGVVKYYFGEKDSILGGRLKLPRECEVYCTLRFKKNKLKEMTIRVEGFTEAEATQLCDDFLAALDGKLPEGYEKFDPVGPMNGNMQTIGYSKGVDDYVISLKRDCGFSDKFYIEFQLDVYAERYGMD